MATYTSHLNLKLPDYSDTADINDLNNNFKKIDDAIASGGTGGGTGGGIVTETDPTVPSWAKQPSKPTYTASEVGARPDSWTPSASDVGADAAGTASGAVAAHNTSGAAHADLRALIEGLTSRLNALADSDDTTLDQLSEIVAYIKSNKALIDAVTTGKVSISDIVDNLTTNASGKVLSAAQGVALKAMIDGIVIPTALPNPQPITINGQRYDGSEAVEVNVAAEGGGATVELDTTLTQSGMAADAKAVGDQLSALNTAIDAKGDPTDEQINTAVSAYLTENPVTGGFSSTLKIAMYNLLMDAVYQSSGHENDKNALLELIGGTSGGGVEEKPEITYYTITKNLTNVSIDNGAASIEAGASYTATLTADDGFTLSEASVVMGGKNVSVSNGVITIDAVTGNITITATATANDTEQPSVGWENGQIISDFIEGEVLNDNGAIVTGGTNTNGSRRTDYIYIYGAQYIRFIGNSSWARYGFYDSAKEFISLQWQGQYAEVPENAVYVVVSGGGENDSYPLNGIQILGAIEPAWTDGVPYELTIVKNEYYESGVIKTYNGWDRTEMVNCYGAGKVVLSSELKYAYCALYDTAGNYYAKPSINNNTIVLTKQTGYVAFSAESSSIASLVVTPFASAE